MSNIFSRISERLKIKRLDKKVKEITKEPEKKIESIEKPKEKETGLKSKIEEINEKLNRITQETKTKDELKKKAFKLPFRVKSQLKKLALKNKVQVILLQNNRNIKTTIGELKDGMLLVGDKIYDGSTSGIWLWNGKFPTAIVPEWDLKPLTPEGLLSEATENKRLANPQSIIIRAIEFKESLQPKQIAGKTMIWLLIGGVIVFYVLFAGGGGG